MRRLPLVLVLLFIPGNSNCQELLPDPSFEAIPPGVHYTSGEHYLGGWRYSSMGPDGSTFTAVTPGRSGQVAARLTRATYSGDSSLDIRADDLLIPVEPLAQYTASLWGRSAAGSVSNILFIWLGPDMQQIRQESVVFRPESAYTQFTRTVTAPASSAYLSFGMRIQGPGEAEFDDCSVVRSADPPPPPDVWITYPVDEEVDTLRPEIAFAAAACDGYEAILSEGEGVTRTWTASNPAERAFAFGEELRPDSSYEIRLRVLRDGAWSTYTTPVSFSTPALPIVKLEHPVEAEQVWGPPVTVRWEVESSTAVAQRLRVDSGAWQELDGGQRDHTLTLSDGLHTVRLEVTADGQTVQHSSTFYVISTPAETGDLYYYDASWVTALSVSNPAQAKIQWDVLHAVAALQGLVNRDEIRFWVKLTAQDTTWLNTLRAPGGWLSQKNLITLPGGLNNLGQLFATFSSYYDGAVLWDPNVLSTSNVAATVAGADDLIPIRYDLASGSVYRKLVLAGPQIPVALDLNGRFTGSGTIWDTGLESSGSSKNDAYLWAVEKYLKTGKCNPGLLMYSIDSYWQTTGYNLGNQLVNRDYIVQNKGFVFDLHVWGDETPVDDPNQPLGTDLNTLKDILYEAAIREQGMVHLVGFVPWPFKYTNWSNAGGSHEPVPTEWEAARILSYYNTYMDADTYGYADISNASIYSQFPLPERLTQNARPSLEDLRRKGYIDPQLRISPLNFLNFYMGDYDAGAWLATIGYNLWSDPVRGSVPVSWAFNPNHIKRMGAIYAHYNRTRSALDSFIAGDSGAGYVNPSCLIGSRLSGLPPADEKWQQHNLEYFRRTNVKISGFLINGYAGPLGPAEDRMYEPFSGEGVFSQPLWYPQGPHISGTMPALIIKRDLTKNLTQDTDIVAAAGGAGTRFLSYRVVLTNPSYTKNLFDSVQSRSQDALWALVDTPTFAGLQGSHLGHTPDARATYTFDTVPNRVPAGQHVDVVVGMRNDGWWPWPSSGDKKSALRLEWLRLGADGPTLSQEVPIAQEIAAGEGAVLTFALQVPQEPGSYLLRYQIVRGGVPFTNLGDYSWETEIDVYRRLTSPGDARLLPPGTPVELTEAVNTCGGALLPEMLYVEALDRSSGIRVIPAAGVLTPKEGDIFSVRGRTGVAEGEPAIFDGTISLLGAGPPLLPLAVRGRDRDAPLDAGSPEGLLVRAWGWTEDVDDAGMLFWLRDPVVSERLLVLAGDLGDPPAEGSLVEVTGLLGKTLWHDSQVGALRPRHASDVRHLP